MWEQECTAQRLLLASVSARKEQSQDQSQKAVRSSAEALVQLRQQQQLYDQLPAWLDKLLVHCGPLLVSPKHLSLDQKEIVAIVCYAAARCQVGIMQAFIRPLHCRGKFLANLLQEIGSLQRVISDLQQHFGQKHISSVASCNPDNPDTKLRISNNALRWEDTSLQGRIAYAEVNPCLMQKYSPGYQPRSTGRVFLPMPLRKQSMNGKGRGMSHLRWLNMSAPGLGLSCSRTARVFKMAIQGLTRLRNHLL